jgi:DNA (cytosine-5)-methyltransferase 1
VRFGSVCSGIEAASVAWEPLGWSAAWLSEIETFPRKVLAHHYPTVPNLGDMRTISRRVLTGEVEAPDVLVGGTPCQAFSIAGLREGLADERGQLTISYVRLLDAIDFIRGRNGKRAAICVWENVPGVLSSKDNAFGCLLAGLAGEDVELVPPGKKWANAGCVYGPKRTVAWRVLDAQYFGVAQRRRRVFVVASARKDCDPEKILFEFDGVRRNSAPSREAGQETAGTLASRTGAGGFPGTDEACSGYLQAFGGGNTGGSIDVATCLTTSGQRLDFDTETFAIQAGALRTNPNSGPDGIGVQSGIAYTMEARAEVQAVCVTGEITHTLKAEGFDASEDGTGRGQPIVPAISVFDPNQVTSATNRSQPTPELSHTLPARAEPPVAYSTSGAGFWRDGIGALRARAQDSHENVAVSSMAVRRLMPTECESLQAFPRNYTNIPGAADGPRYKALGNSMCVNVMAFIGRRIQQATAKLKEAA